jgi:hypothetical protein
MEDIKAGKCCTLNTEMEDIKAGKCCTFQPNLELEPPQ